MSNPSFVEILPINGGAVGCATKIDINVYANTKRNSWKRLVVLFLLTTTFRPPSISIDISLCQLIKYKTAAYILSNYPYMFFESIIMRITV